MILTAFLLGLVPALPSAPCALAPRAVATLATPVVQAKKGNDTRERYIALHAKNDRAGCVALWREHPGAVLPTIDADLEGSLKLIESSKTPDEAKIKTMRERALFGALAAEEATGHPILVDYVSSFVGWNAEQQKFFRTGQAVFKQSMEQFQKGDNQAALQSGRECVERASSLGDWWGTAMGYGAQGMAYQGMGSLDDALLAYSRARLLNHDLGLMGDEYDNLRSIVDLCVAQKQDVRGAHALEQAITLATKLGDKAGLEVLVKRRK